MMKSSARKLIIVILILLIIASLCESARRRRVSSKFKNKLRTKLPKLKNQKQLLYETRETNPPNFVTLLMMRLVYGLATSMGIEDRLPDFLAPPNADDGDFFGLGGGGGGGGGGIAGIFGGGGDDYDLGF